jgi:hypothetical protein
MIYVIINEQHSLFQEQIELLNALGTLKPIIIPSEGIKKEQMESFEADNKLVEDDEIVFASPIPYLLKILSRKVDYNGSFMYNVSVFHNDKRIKKELPNGKIIQTVSSEGWEIL